MRLTARTLVLSTIFVSFLMSGSPGLGQSSAHSTAHAPADHVVLISIDGLRPEFYLDRTWPAPKIQQMARDGVSAEGVLGVFPSVTYPSHTSMVTGALPARHGIYNNRPFEPSGQTGRWYWHESAIKVETLWDLVRASGRQTAAFSWPVTDGAPIDYFVPEVWALSGDALGPMRDGTRPAGLWQELGREATGNLDAARFSPDYMSRDDIGGAAGAYLLETYKPALLAVHLLAADHFEHADGRDSDRVRLAVSAVDRAVAAIVDAADRAGILERTAFLVTGDHGFVELHTSVAPNVWLAHDGLTGTEPDRGEWRASFHTSGGSALLYLKDPSDRAAAVRVRALLTEQPQPLRRLFRVIERKELDEMGADPTIALALTGALGVSFSARASGDALGRATGGTHGYDPEAFPEIRTGFIGWGAGLVEGGRIIHRMRLVDIAPTVARLLGLEFEVPDGIIVRGALSE